MLSHLSNSINGPKLIVEACVLGFEIVKDLWGQQITPVASEVGWGVFDIGFFNNVVKSHLLFVGEFDDAVLIENFFWHLLSNDDGFSLRMGSIGID